MKSWENKTGNVCITQYWGVFAQPFLQWKTIGTTCYERVFLVLLSSMQAKLMHHVMSSVACPSVPYFSTLSPKRHDLNKIYIYIFFFYMKCLFWFSLQLSSETFLILRRTKRGIIIRVHKPVCKVFALMSDFNKTGIFSTDFRKILKYQHPSSSSRLVPRGRADRQTDRQIWRS